MLCETCLGQNPYVRMIKMPFGQKLCTVSQVPYQSFRWKAGPKGRYKETIVSYVIARDRNICQACLNDMKYGLPVGVRDKLLKEEQNQIAMPNSDVGQRYYYEQQAQLQASGQVVPSTMANDMLNVAPSNQMIKFAQIHQAKEAASKTAFRNLPKLCSFWVGGGCMRVKRKVCPFRPCCGTFVFPELAATHRDLMTDLIKKLEADGPDKVQTNLSDEVRAAFKESGKGNKEQAIRKRVHGDDDLTARYLGKMNSMVCHGCLFYHVRSILS
jgi:pre-mRNA-splicing factor RBM22/SLT11